MKDLSKNLNVDLNIIWAGWQSDLISFYAASDIYIMPSRWESFGLVFIEAMNFSLPIITTNVQAIPEVVEDRKVGLLSDSENEKQLSNNIKLLLEDEDLRIQLGRNGKECLKYKFTYENFVRGHSVVYQENNRIK